MRRCVCPGSYDPVTLGHVDVIHRATAVFDQVVVAVVVNHSKHTTFTSAERRDFLLGALDAEDLRTGRITVDVVDDGLLADYCRREHADAIVKGLRSGTDYAYELPMAQMNRELTGIETVFVPGAPGLAYVSSSMIREVALLGGDVSAFVPAGVASRLASMAADRAAAEPEDGR